jgi:hypothetical protein
MASKTVQEFLKTLPSWSDAIQRLAIGIFNQEAMNARGESIYRAPVDTGNLANSSQLIRARVTPTGIVSGYVFKANNKGFYYPWVVNEGVRDGKKLNIKTEKNPNAQSKFAEAGIAKVEDDLMSRMVDLVTEVFIKA